MEKPVLSLQPSEAALFAAASRIYSGYLAAGRVAEGSENDMIARSISEALRMAQTVEEAIRSDQEFD